MADDKQQDQKQDQKPRAPRKGFTRLKAPHARVSAFSCDGVEYIVEKGVLEVSDLHIARAVEHGFLLEQPASE